MKKSLLGIFVVSAIAMSMASCTREPLINGIIAFSATTPSEASWSGKETIVFFSEGSPAYAVEAVKGDKTYCNPAFTSLPTTGTIYAVSTYTETEPGVNTISTSQLEISIPAEQTSRSAYCDANAQVLFGTYSYTDGLPHTDIMQMKSLSANVKLAVTNTPEALNSVTLTFPSNVTGKFNYAIGTGAWTETEGANTITVQAGAGTDGKVFYFGCAAMPLTGNVTAEFIGAVTGTRYSVTIPASSMDLTSGSQITVSIDIPLQLYIAGSAVGKTAAADAIEMTRNLDGSFTWTGDMAAEGKYTLLFGKTGLTPALAAGDAYNQIRYSTDGSTPFEVEKAGNYTINVWPKYGHIQVIRNFDHLLSGENGSCPMFNEFDEDSGIAPGHPREWETRFGCIWQDHGYSTFGIDNIYRLSGKNCYWLEASSVQTDRNQGCIIRSGDWQQPYAVAGKTYTVYMQMMYEGDSAEEKIVWRLEGALGSGAGHEEEVVLENGVPKLIVKDFVADGTWGGCTNFFIYFNKISGPVSFYLDGINIGYDD